MSHKDFCIYVNSTEFQEKLKLYNKVVNGGEECFFDVDDLIDIADYYYSIKNDADKALQAAKYCLGLYPDEEMALYIIARIYLNEFKDSKRATHYLEKVDNYMDSTEGVLIHAEILLSQGQGDIANEEFLAEYEKIKKEAEHSDIYGIDDEDEDDYYDAKLMLEEYPLDVAMLFNDYMFYIQAEQWIKKMPVPPKEKQYEYWHTWGCIYFSTGRLEESVDAYNKAIDIDAYSIRSWLQLCDAQYQLNRIDDAMQSTDYILALDPNNEDGLLYRGCCLLEKRDFNNALQIFDKVLTLYPQNPRPHIFHAIIALEGEDVKTATEEFCNAIDKSNGDINILTDIGILLYDMGFKEGTYYLFKILLEAMIEHGMEVDNVIAQYLVRCCEAIGIDEQETNYYKLFIPSDINNSPKA
jgi:tetratricopeptide (TPR) repeat protein